MPPSEQVSGFQTTAWTLLAQLRGEDPAARDFAVRAIVTRYWPAVYSAVRAMGKPAEQAAEITQSFFADVVLGRRLLESADRGRGRLRTLLLTSLKRFQIDLYRRENSRGSGALVPLHGLELEEERLLPLLPQADPDTTFDRRWAAAVLEEALGRAERHFRQNGRERNWMAFEARVVTPAMRACDPPPMAQLAVELGFPGVAETSAAVQVVRKRVMALLREVVAETAEEDQEAELEYLLRLLNQR